MIPSFDDFCGPVTLDEILVLKSELQEMLKTAKSEDVEKIKYELETVLFVLSEIEENTLLIPEHDLEDWIKETIENPKIPYDEIFDDITENAEYFILYSKTYYFGYTIENYAE